MNILIFLIILIVLVLVHEFGHFFVAKRFGIRVDEFGFGFPPRIFGKKIGETLYSVNMLPLGGFVKIFGESLDEADLLEVGFLDKKSTPEKIDFSRSLVHKPRYQQALVMFAGIFFNFILAWLLFSFGLMSGLPTSAGNQPKGSILKDVNLVIISVLPNSPAENAGIKTGDKIVLIKSGDETLSEINPNTLKSFVLSHPEKELEFGYLRKGVDEMNITKITPVSDIADGKPSIGIAMDQIGIAKLSILRAFWEGMKLDISATKDTAIGFYTLIKEGIQGKGSFASVAGPVGMVGMVGDLYDFGFSYLLSFTALISINLAIINLIPFPALDGGRLLFLLIEKIKGSRINPKVANITNMVGFSLLIILMIFITYNDIVKLF
ncbi:RIP metalloprotease RseP [Patescibacteria group bacterium]|nr:RIP metalloprotease RseP [Patescibacteria group bacterium]MBU1727937.1 RIP metalloprotease RseP [Patescibacteria group bacterium]